MIRSADGHICGIYGPHAAASNDINLLQASELRKHLKDWEFIIGDGIFRGPRLSYAHSFESNYSEVDQFQFYTPLHPKELYDYWGKLIGSCLLVPFNSI
jgi:hypothetical protein